MPCSLPRVRFENVKFVVRVLEPLATLQRDKPAVVTRVKESKNQELLCYLSELGVIPGAEVTVIDVAPFNGPLTLDINNERQVIGYHIAEAIQVQPLATKEP